VWGFLFLQNYIKTQGITLKSNKQVTNKIQKN